MAVAKMLRMNPNPNRLKRSLPGAMLIFLALLLWQCNERFPSAQKQNVPEEHFVANTPAPTFSAETVEGQPLNLADYKGKVVLLNFGASHSAPSRAEFSFLVKLHEKAKRGAFTVIAINRDTNAEKLKTFLAQLETWPSFPIINDTEGKISKLFEIKNLPATLLLDKQGLMRYRRVGFAEEEKEKLGEEVRNLLVE